MYRDSFFYGSVWIGDEIPIAALMENHGSEPEFSDNSEQGPESPEQDLIPQENPEEQLEEKSEEEEKREAERESEEEEEKREAERESEEEEKREPERRAEEEELSTDSEDLLMKMWIDTEKMAKPVDNIFNKAFRQGYKISVEQLKKFSPEAARMAENQFLLKGYNRYQHLLAGKVMYAGRERYCIGVPGIYENRERYMAEIYQFPVFLSLTENRIKTGGFGYWLHLLQE